MERVEKGEKYFFVNEIANVEIVIEQNSPLDGWRYNANNYFVDIKEAETTARKLRVVLKGADVIEMPSKEEILKKSEQLLTDYYDAPAELCAESLKEWLNSQIVK